MNECQLIGPRLIETTGISQEETVFRALLQAYDCARSLGRDPWQFAVELQEFAKLGVNSCDLRKLIALGLVAHALERSGARASRRRFCRAKSLAFAENSCFVLTEQGESHARQGFPGSRLLHVRPSAGSNDVNHHNGHASSTKPYWDLDSRILSVGELVVKQFKRAAPHQELIIASFQELGWNSRIDDPIPQDKGIDAKQRLHTTIKKLNRGQCNALIRFYGDGTGRGVCWELRKA